MILIHQTDSDFLADILRTGYLTPATKNRNNGGSYHGEDVFLPYVYVSCYDKRENIRYLVSPAFVFPVDVLCDRTFYVNGRFVGGVVESTEYFKRDSAIGDITAVLGRKVEESKAEVYRRFRSKNVRQKSPYIHLYPEVMFRKRLPIKDATHVVLSRRTSKSVRDAISEKYPHVQIVDHEGE